MVKANELPIEIDIPPEAYARLDRACSAARQQFEELAACLEAIEVSQHERRIFIAEVIFLGVLILLSSIVVGQSVAIEFEASQKAAAEQVDHQVAADLSPPAVGTIAAPVDQVRTIKGFDVELRAGTWYFAGTNVKAVWLEVEDGPVISLATPQQTVAGVTYAFDPAAGEWKAINE